jgi:general stress protein YciG
MRDVAVVGVADGIAAAAADFDHFGGRAQRMTLFLPGAEQHQAAAQQSERGEPDQTDRRHQHGLIEVVRRRRGKDRFSADVRRFRVAGRHGGQDLVGGDVGVHGKHRGRGPRRADRGRCVA